MTNATFPHRVRTIGASAFRNCAALARVDMGDGVATIGPGAFFGCGQLADLSLCPEVEFIGESAFRDCSALTSLAMPSGVKTISMSAFQNCSGLRRVVMGAFVTHVESHVFQGCESLEAVYFTGNMPAEDGFVFNRPTTVCRLPGAPGWPTVPKLWSEQPTALWLPRVHAEGLGAQTGGFGFNIGWAPSKSVAVEACTNLADPIWVPIGTTNTVFDGTSSFGDPEWTNHPQRIYRVVPAPGGAQPFPRRRPVAPGMNRESPPGTFRSRPERRLRRPGSCAAPRRGTPRARTARRSSSPASPSSGARKSAPRS